MPYTTQHHSPLMVNISHGFRVYQAHGQISKHFILNILFIIANYDHALTRFLFFFTTKLFSRMFLQGCFRYNTKYKSRLR